MRNVNTVHMSFQGDTTKLEGIRFYSDEHEQVPLKDLPTTLIATILQQGETLRASAAVGTGA